MELVFVLVTLYKGSSRLTFFEFQSEIESLRQENERLNKLGLDSELADAKANPTDSFTSFAGEMRNTLNTYALVEATR